MHRLAKIKQSYLEQVLIQIVHKQKNALALDFTSVVEIFFLS